MKPRRIILHMDTEQRCLRVLEALEYIGNKHNFRRYPNARDILVEVDRGYLNCTAAIFDATWRRAAPVIDLTATHFDLTRDIKIVDDTLEAEQGYGPP